MKKITYIIFASILALTACNSDIKTYLPQAAFGGLKGEIDSVKIVQYKPSEAEEIDLIETINVYTFDKNGYVIKEHQQIYNSANMSTVEVITTTNRTKNSLPINQITSQIFNDIEMKISLEMNVRGDNKESYIVQSIKSDDVTEMDEKELIGQEWIVKTFKDKTINTIMTFDGMESNTDETFDDWGRLIYKSVEVTNEDRYDEDATMNYENEFTYDDNGLLTRNIITRENELGTSIEYYKNYKLEDNYPHNWVGREVLNENGELIRVETQTIFYRRK